MHNMGIHMGLLQSASTLMAACGRRVARASRRLRRDGRRLRSLDCAKIAPSWVPYLSRRISLIPLRGHYWRRRKEDAQGRRGEEESGTEREEAVEEEEEESSDVEEEEEDVEGVLWRKTILMGEKCQPLDFSGVIYYDSKGRRLPGLPPRSPLRSPLPDFSFPVVVASEKMAVAA